jgi:CRISPR-associated protein Cas2
MRRCFLICYDIRDPKRLRKVHQVCKGFGETWQYSIFFCVLKPIDRVRLQAELEDVMNLHEDQALVIDLGADEDQARATAAVIGQPQAMNIARGTIVV